MANNKRFITKNGVDVNSNTIINVSNPLNAQDAATKSYVDTSANGLQTSLDTEESARIAGDSATLSSAQSYADSAEADAIAAAEAKDVVRAAAANAYADQAEADAKSYADGIVGTEATARANADAALQTELNTTQAGAGLGASGAYTAIGVYDADTNATGGYYIGGATSLANADKLLDSALKAEELVRSAGDSATLSSAQSYADSAEADAIAAAEAKDVVRAAAANAYADQAEADAKAYTDTRESAITTAYQAADTVLQNNINTEKGRIDAILTASTADKDTFAEIVTFINSVDTTNDTALGTEITTRANADAALQTELDATQAGAGLGASGAYTAIGVYDADTNTTGGHYIGGATSLVNADKLLDSALKAVDTGYKAASADFDSRLDIIEGNATTAGSIQRALADANAYADQAEADAIAAAEAKDVTRAAAANAYADQVEVDAKAYTDTRETAITTAYQTYADQAEVDAKAYTDTRESAITTAYQTYADQAEVDAIAAAEAKDVVRAAAANAYADSAEADAKAYTDTRETAITTAYQTYADSAEASAITSANTYTDGREIAITTAYQNYADQAEVDAIISANAYTDGRETAITTAYQAADSALNSEKVSKTSAQALAADGNVLTASGNILTLKRGDGTTDTVDLSLYLDDTNAAVIQSGVVDGTGIATFTRDDNTTFTVDLSLLLDDTNLPRIISAGWNTSNGVLTLTRNDETAITVDLDDRYSLGSHNHTLDSLSNTTITSNTAGEILKWNGSAWINNTLAEAGIATESYVTTAISNLVNGADAAYDTLKEIQDAMATDAELSAAISAITIGNGTVTVNTGSGLTGSGSFTMNQTGATTVTLSHADTSSVANVSSNNSGGVFIQDVALTFDAYGHTTGASVATATMTNFHSGVTDINSTVASNNASGSVNITFTDLVGAVHYNVYLNRILLRPSEVTNVNTSTGQVTIATGVLATDDELEVTGLKIA